MNDIVKHDFSTRNWMAATPAIDSLTLSELTLPGTHNAGSDWDAFGFIPPAHWLACQHQSFYSQLNYGARALDLRLIFEHKAEDLQKFRFHHSKNTSSRTLQDLQTDVINFLDENPNEFIVFDFHELTDGDKPFDFKLFNEMFLAVLGDRMIPVQNQYLSLSQLKQISTKQRLVVAAPVHSELKHTLFFSKIDHMWIGPGTPSASDVKKFITEEMKHPPGRWAPWSLSATAYATFGGPVDIHGEIDQWFDPLTSQWTSNCNIINVDFMEESKIVAHCRNASIANAARKHR